MYNFKCRYDLHFPLISPAKSYKRERLSTVDLLLLISLDQILFILKILFTLFKKQATLIRRPTVLSRPPQLVFPAYSTAKLVGVFIMYN